jgi:formyltetrahydrofolate synthetase
MDCEGSEIEICKNYLENSPKKIKTHFAIASYHYREDYMSKTNKILKKMFGSKNIKTIDKNKKHLTTYIDTTL